MKGLVLGAALLGAAASISGATSVIAEEDPLLLEIRFAESEIALQDFDQDGVLDRGDGAVAEAPLRERRSGQRVGRSFIECTAMTAKVNAPRGRGIWAARTCSGWPTARSRYEGGTLRASARTAWR